MTFEEIRQLVSPQFISAYYAANPRETEPYFGELKFPNRKQTGITFDTVYGRGKSPVKLSASALDVQAIKLTRGDFEVKEGILPFFKNILSVDEKLIAKLEELDRTNSDAVGRVLERIFNDQANLLNDARLTREILRMQALCTGVVSIADNGQSHTFDYGVPVDHKTAPGTKWDQDGASPIEDLKAWKRKIEEDTGVSPSEVLLEDSTVVALSKNKAIREAIYVLANGAVTPGDAEVAGYIRRQTGLTIYSYNKGYKNDAGKFVTFVPKGTVVLMPSGVLGDTRMGTTPEERAFAGGKYNLQVVDDGVTLSSHTAYDPVNIDMKVSMYSAPSFDKADQVYIANVLTA